MANALNMFGEEDFAERIKRQVGVLLSITDDYNISVAKATEFSSTLGIMGAGLAAFAGGQFIGALANAASSILGFLTGSDSPIEEMVKVADKADDLQKVLMRWIKSVHYRKSQDSDLMDLALNIKEFAGDLMDSVCCD